MDIEAGEGSVFISGGADKTVKVWDYDLGECIASGSGHSGAINGLRISPDNKSVITVGSEGAIFIWDMPKSAPTAGGK